MKIDELINKLVDIQNRIGDEAEVFFNLEDILEDINEVNAVYWQGEFEVQLS